MGYGDILVRIFAAFSTLAVVLSSFYGIFRFYVTYKLLSGSMSLETPGFEGLLIPSIVFFSLTAFVVFYLSSKIWLGSPKNEFTPLSLVFDEPRLFASRILKGRYSLGRVFIFAFIVSLFFSLASFTNDYLYIQANMGLVGDFGLNEARGFSMGSQIPSLMGPASFIFSLSGVFMSFFALAFFFYWLLRAFGERTDYLYLYALVVSFSLIPLAFFLASAFVNLASFLLLGDISTLTMCFFPYVGAIISYYILYLVFKDRLDDPLKAKLLVTPFILSALFLVYMTYFHYYVFPAQVFEAVLYQLGVFA